jgi:hypothetical protein
MSDLIPSGELGQLKKLIDRQLAFEERVEELELELKEKKKRLRDVSQQDIPDFLANYGLSEIKLDDGRKVTVKSDVSVTIKNQEEFYDFLRERHDDSIIKSIATISDPTDEIRLKLSENGIHFTQESKIHSQTLKAYFREFMSLGLEPPESVNVYVYSKARIK